MYERSNLRIMTDPLDATPLFVQLANRIEEQIYAGKLKPGQILPSEKTLQQIYDVSRGTARKGVEELRNRGLVVTIQARGSYVVDELPPRPSR